MPRKMTKNSPIRVKAALRRRDVAELRGSDLTWQEIADKLDISETRVRQLFAEFDAEFRVECKELAEANRREQLMKIKLLMAKWFPVALDPANGTKPLDSVTRLLAHESSLTGSKAAVETKTELTGANGGPLQTLATTVDLSTLSEEQLATLQKAHAMLQGLQAGSTPSA